MNEQDRRLDEERRLQRAAIIAATGQVPEPVSPGDPDTTGETDRQTRATDQQESEEDRAAANRVQQQALWVDLQIRQAMARGEFDHLPGAGKPIRDLGSTHDPDWWVKKLVEREQITGVLPPALGLRKEDAELDAQLDRETTEEAVRRIVDDFNRRIVEARRQLLGGPPVVTPTRDVDREVAAWRARRDERRSRQREQLSPPASAPGHPARERRRWLPRSRRRHAG